MFIKSDIRKVTIALEKSLGHEVYLRLGNAGIIHLARMQMADTSTDASLLTEEAKAHDIIRGIAFLLSALGIDTGGTPVSIKIRDQEKDALFVSKVKRRMERLQRARARLQDKAVVIAEQLEYAEALNTMGVDPGTLKKARFTRMLFGRISDPLPETHDCLSFIITAAGNYVFGAALPKNAPAMLQFLKGHGFTDKTTEVDEASLEELKKRESAIKRSAGAIERYIDNIRKENGPELLNWHHSYREYEQVLKAMRLSGFSSKAIFITGWIDAKDKPRLVNLLEHACRGSYILTDERDPNAPVRMINSRLFKPFEPIVKLMGLPANSEIDPTPLAAVTFVLVFGLMFGDLGQGLILVLAGLILKYIARKKNHEGLENAGGILLICGLFAAFCGVLYGNLFSSEHLIPALWLRPTEKIMTLFSVTVLLGAVIIVTGLGINIVNAFINGNYTEALLEKKGMAVLILYSAVVIFAVRFMIKNQMPSMGEIGIFVFLPLMLYSLRGIIGPLLFNSEKPHDIVEYITETVMDIVEIALSMFANTVSFIRVGAFALSHAGLSIVTYTIAEMADPNLKSVVAIAIVVTGNIFIIGFEGLICGIQSMRLEYYEFFSKFYRGDGVDFSPFITRGKISEV